VIFAENSTITGSIGVIAQVPNLQGTMKKIGAEMITFKSTNADRWKDMLSPWKPIPPRQRKRMTILLDKLQGQFERMVRAGRGDRIKIRKVKYSQTLDKGDGAEVVQKTELVPFNGKAYLAGEAKALGLIDEIGFLEDAYRRAGELAGLSKPSVRRYNPRASVISQLFGQQSASLNLDISLDSIDKLQSPRLLVLWMGD
jgi:protease-4